MVDAHDLLEWLATLHYGDVADAGR